jgi:alcohol dehydrogenase class IV
LNFLSPFDAALPSRLVYGPGEIERIGTLVAPLGSKALVVIGGGSVRRSGVLDHVLGLLDDAGVGHEILEGVSGNPKSSEADRAGEAMRSGGCDVVLGLGGGSVMDVAKAAALVAGHGTPIHRFLRKEESPGDLRKAPAIVCVPTIAGTGSEANDTSVLTDEETGLKGSLRGPVCVPRVCVLDPDLTETAPRRFALASGGDALCHAIEAYLTRRSNLLSDALARSAAELLIDALPRLGENDPEARGATLVGASLAGQALSLSASLVTHALEHPVSARLDAHHGEGLAALQPAVLERVCGGAPERCAEVASWLGEGARPELAADAFRGFLEGCGLEIRLSQLGMNEGHVEKFVDDALASGARGLTASPIDLERKDLVGIYEAALAE